MVAEWHDIAALPDDAVAERIRVDQLDVLIDLSGHTSWNRLAVLAQKPAPVQVTLFAYPNTTGLSAVDWRITDSLADPLGAESPYVEQLLRLPVGGVGVRRAEEQPRAGRHAVPRRRAVAPSPRIHT